MPEGCLPCLETIQVLGGANGGARRRCRPSREKERRAMIRLRAQRFSRGHRCDCRPSLHGVGRTVTEVRAHPILPSSVRRLCCHQQYRPVRPLVPHTERGDHDHGRKRWRWLRTRDRHPEDRFSDLSNASKGVETRATAWDCRRRSPAAAAASWSCRASVVGRESA